MSGIVVIQLNRLGDLHQTLPVLRALESKARGEDLLLICCTDFAKVLPVGAFDGITVALSREKLAHWVNRLRACEAGKIHLEAVQAELPEILRRRFDRVINLTHDEPSAALSFLLDVESRAGRIWSPAGEIRLAGDWSKYLFSLVQYRLDNLFNLVDVQLGIAGMTPGARAPALRLSLSQRQRGRDLMEAAGWDGKEKGLAIQMGASDSFRALSPRRFAEAVTLLHGESRLPICVVGASGDRPLLELFQKHYAGPVIDLIGKTAMSELPMVLAHCHLLLSNDTGTLHAAASVGTPTLGLFFATAYFSETAPYGAGHVALQAALPCSPCSGAKPCPVQHCRQAFSPEAIAQTARWIIEGRQGKAPGPYPALECYVSDFTADGTLLYAPAPGWPAPPRYQQALAWRRAFTVSLGLENRLSLPSPSALPPLPTEDLADLAQALEEVSAHLMRLESLGPQQNPRVEAIAKAQEAARASMENLIGAQQRCGPWGGYVRFDLLGPEGHFNDITLADMRRRHLRLAARTRELLLSSEAWHEE